MKLIYILRHYMKGIRLSVLVLTGMTTWAMLNGVVVYGKVQNIGTDLRVLKSGDTRNAAVLMCFPTHLDLTTGSDRENAEAVESALESEAIVKDVFSIKVANPVSYKGNGISIVLYEPEMVAFFPELKRLGVNFDNNLNGCILGSKLFGGLNAGDTISLDFGKVSADFSVSGRISSPYRRMTLSSSSTDPYARHLFKEGDIIIMPTTDSVMAQINVLAKRIEYDTNLIVTFMENTTEDEREALIESVAPQYLYNPLNEVIKNSEEEVEATLKEELAQPMFLAISAAVAYLSIVILTFKKKEKDTAVFYLCGCSRPKCAVIHFAVFQVFALIPLLINMVFILIWPQIEWNYGQILAEVAPTNEALAKAILAMFYYFDSITVNTSCLIVVCGYYFCTAAIALVALIVSMARHTPMTYLRGASR